MAKVVTINLDPSRISYILCRRLNTFTMIVELRDKTTGQVKSLTGQSWQMEVFDEAGTNVLVFAPGNGCTIINNRIYFEKTKELMTLAAGLYSFGIFQIKATGAGKTRFHGDFEVLEKYDKR